MTKTNIPIFLHTLNLYNKVTVIDGNISTLQSYTASNGKNFEQTLALVQMYFKNSQLELRILQLEMGLVKEPMGLQLEAEM